MSKINQLESLRVLKTVVEFGSFSAAAKQLNLSVARVSKSVSSLESELAAKLFVRSTRHLQPTDNGMRCYQYAIKMLEEWSHLTDEVTEAQFKPQGNIKISVPMTWGVGVFSTIAAKFMVRYPDINLDVFMTDTYVNVIEGDYDLVLRLASELEDSTLLCKKLKSYRFIACASPDYLKNNPPLNAVEDLHRHKCLAFSQEGSNPKWEFIKDNKRVTHYVNVHLKSNNSILLKDALLSHVGIAVVPDFVVGDYIESGELVPVLQGYKTKDLNLYSLRVVDQLLPKRLQLFIQYISDELNR